MTQTDESGSGATRWPTRDELDYEARKEAGFPGLGVPSQQSKGVVTSLQAPFAVEDNDTSAYIGVASEYMTYAEETNKPLAADGGVEEDLEKRLLQQPVLVAPVEEVTGNQTDGGGSSQETVYTALSGENFSAEMAKPLETETKDVSTPPQPGQVEVGVSGGSTGQTVGEAEEQRLTEQVEQQGGTTPEQEANTGDATGTPASTQTSGTPTPTKKTTTPKQSS